jgi:hypothetical protein
MKKLSLSDLANLAEVVGAVAIVVSLIYVGQELKANTAAVQAASLQSITNSSAISLLAVAESGELAAIRVQGDADPTQLSETDRLRYILYQRQVWLHFQNVWTQWQLGVFDDQIWTGYMYVICSDLVGSSARKEWWRATHSSALSTKFSILIESCS